MQSVRDRIEQTALDLFSQFGYFGVNQQDLIQHADITPLSFYQYFSGLESVFQSVLDRAIQECLDPGGLALVAWEGTGRKNRRAMLQRMATRWYESLRPQTARLLMQAALSRNRVWEEQVESYLAGVVGLLASVIGPVNLKRNPRRKCDPRIAAKILIMGLFQSKVRQRSAKPARDEKESLDEFFQLWMQQLLGG